MQSLYKALSEFNTPPGWIGPNFQCAAIFQQKSNNFQAGKIAITVPLQLVPTPKSADTLIVCHVFATMVFKNDKVLNGNKCFHCLLYLVKSLNLQ